jgi:hypothetical protein
VRRARGRQANGSQVLLLKGVTAMRIMRVMFIGEDDVRVKGAVDLDKVLTAGEAIGMTNATEIACCDCLFWLDMPFEEFLREWSGGNILMSPLKEDPAINRSMSVEDVLGEEE